MPISVPYWVGSRAPRWCCASAWVEHATPWWGDSLASGDRNSKGDDWICKCPTPNGATTPGGIACALGAASRAQRRLARVLRTSTARRRLVMSRALAWLRDLDTGPGGGYDVYDGSCRFSAVEAGSSACASAWPSVLKRSGDQRVLLVLPR